MRVGFGFDAHPLAEGRPFIVGGVRVDHDRGPSGHSDADVLAHAIADALLGAAALGDLGERFPASDERWKNADSMDLLARCAADVRAAGYVVGNIDATVVVDAPKLATHVPEMRQRIAAALELTTDRVSVKAKRTEGLGYTGDGTGIAAMAVATVEPA
jgi:2-C-methyl-D-erythritol 2,4-cyclodiphosphate synthase